MITYREMTRADFDAVFEMMRDFYTSPAVASDGSAEIYRADIEACLDPRLPLRGFVFEQGGAPAGYAMTFQGFCTEYGRPCLWIEDLYLRPEARGQGAAKRFLTELAEQYPDAVLRLESETENADAVRVYRAVGFEDVPYMGLWKR